MYVYLCMCICMCGVGLQFPDMSNPETLNSRYHSTLSKHGMDFMSSLVRSHYMHVSFIIADFFSMSTSYSHINIVLS